MGIHRLRRPTDRWTARHPMHDLRLQRHPARNQEVPRRRCPTPPWPRERHHLCGFADLRTRHFRTGRSIQRSTQRPRRCGRRDALLQSSTWWRPHLLALHVQHQISFLALYRQLFWVSTKFRRVWWTIYVYATLSFFVSFIACFWVCRDPLHPTALSMFRQQEPALMEDGRLSFFPQHIV